jgi:enterochelin esterase-like enzyme
VSAFGSRGGARWSCLGALAASVVLTAPSAAQVATDVPPVVPGAKPVAVERIKIPGPALEGNLEGNASVRDALVFLPPGYVRDTTRRYPVVYALHGYSIGAEQWSREIHVPQTIEGAFAHGAKEVIVVLPDSKTVHNGSMYSSSVTTGDFERFVARDVVAHMDAHYRTMPQRASRGLVGHSMGGYGATRIGMKHADVFGSVYVMSPCCLSPRQAGPPNPELEKSLDAVKTPDDSAGLPFFARAQLATAAAWSPDPKSPPLFLSLPTRGGEPQPDVLAKWAANAPLAFLDQYVADLRRYRAIAIDVGDEDRLKADAARLHEALDRYGIPHSFEVYKGTHTSKVADRFQNHVLPFFSRSLCFENDCR